MLGERGDRRRVMRGLRRTLQCAACLVCILFLVGCTHSRALKRGDALFESGQYEAALVAYEEALEARPESEEAVAGIRAARAEVVRLRLAEAERWLAEGDVLAALVEWSGASQVSGSYPEVQEFRMKLLQQAIESAEAGLARGDFSYSLRVYEKYSESALSTQYDFAGKHDEISQIWAAKLYETGLGARRDGHEARALLLFGKAAHLDEDPLYQAERDRVWQAVRSQLLYRVHVLQESAANTVNLWTAAEIRAANSPYVQLIRDGLEQEVDANVYVGPLPIAFDYRQLPRTESVEYQSGTRTLSNPEYENLERQLYQAESRLMQAERRTTDEQREVGRYQVELERARERERNSNYDTQSRSALSRLERAQRDLERAYGDVQYRRKEVQRLRDRIYYTDRFVEEPVYSIYSYSVTTYWMAGLVDVDVRIEHRDGREAVVMSRELSVEYSDDAYDSHPIIGLAGKFAELPAEQAIEGRLRRAAAEKVMEAIGESFDGYRATFLKRARASDEASARVDALVRYVLLAGRSAAVTATQEIYELEGISDARQVLLTLPH